MSDDPPILKYGPDVSLSDEMITVDRFLHQPTQLARVLGDEVRGRVFHLLFPRPWERPDTWRGWPTDFILFPRALRVLGRVATHARTATDRAQHAIAALRGSDESCSPSEEWW